VKLATFARDLDDVTTLLRVLLSHPRVPLVLLAMGPVGALSRVFFPAAGSLLTYAFAEGEVQLAPGQLPLRALQAELVRYYPAYATRGRGQEPA
jgi:3-dehydroquinate dehydratase-1